MKDRFRVSTRLGWFTFDHTFRFEWLSNVFYEVFSWLFMRRFMSGKSNAGNYVNWSRVEQDKTIRKELL